MFTATSGSHIHIHTQTHMHKLGLGMANCNAVLRTKGDERNIMAIVLQFISNSILLTEFSCDTHTDAGNEVKSLGAETR